MDRVQPIEAGEDDGFIIIEWDPGALEYDPTEVTIFTQL